MELAPEVREMIAGLQVVEGDRINRGSLEGPLQPTPVSRTGLEGLLSRDAARVVFARAYNVPVLTDKARQRCNGEAPRPAIIPL